MSRTAPASVPAAFGDTLPHAEAPVGPGWLSGEPSWFTRPPGTGQPLHLLDATMHWPADSECGVRQYLSHKRDLLREAGWRHTLLAPGAQGDAGGQAIDCGGWPIPGAHGHRWVMRRGPAARLIEAARPHLIEAADASVLGWSVLDAAQRLNVPAVAFCHNHLPAQLAGRLPAALRHSSPARWARHRAERYVLRLYAGYDMVLAPSRSLVEALRGLGVTHVHHQPLGVDGSVFNAAARDPAWRRALKVRLGLADDERLLLYVGRFTAEQNLQVLADAVARLGRGHTLLAVGTGPTPPRGAQVRVLPAEADHHRLARLMASVDVFVHAGDQETFGLSVLEAMACGTPLVVSAAGGAGELADGVGLTLATQRPVDWADAMQAALVGGRQRVGVDRGIERARQHDWPVVLRALVRRYLRMLGMPVRAPLSSPGSAARFDAAGRPA